MSGYIKLYRKTLDNKIVCKDGDHLAVWVYLLMNAAHKTMRLMFNGQPIDLLPGQLIRSRKRIGDDLGIAESKIQRVLKLFESEQQIEQLTTPRNRLISVVNWQEYQSSEQQTNDKRTTNEQQTNANKNIKNEKNEKKDTSGRFAMFWALYPKKVNKALAQKSFDKLNPSDDLFQIIIEKLNKQKCSPSWTKDNGQFVPHPTTWLNNRRWEDEDKSEPIQLYKCVD